MPATVQEALLAAKRENPRRSIRQLKILLENAGTVSRSKGSASMPEEHRRFVADAANSIWYGDVMHGPTLTLTTGRCKVFLVSLMDDASRLLAHSAFCTSETALAIEGVLKQAVLKRGLPKKLVVDNGAAYRAATLQGICARLDIRLIYCRPYAPEGKGKLERWHRTFRDHFLSELDVSRINDLDDLNARLWAWIEQVYHRTVHGSLDGKIPLARFQQDLVQIKQLGQKAPQLDAIFYHRVTRKVRKDGSVSYQGRDFEVPMSCRANRCAWLSTRTFNRWSALKTKMAKAVGRLRHLMRWRTAIAADANRTRSRPQAHRQLTPHQPLPAPIWWNWPLLNITRQGPRRKPNVSSTLWY